MEKHIVTGIYDKEVFIAAVDEEGKIRWDVIRPVKAELLAELRDPDTYKEYCRDLWESAVHSGNTELGLQEFAQELIDEADVDNDDEAFPCKDDSDCQYLIDELREEADTYLEENEGIEVGTWESAGCYAPASFNGGAFKGWDYVFSTPEAKKMAKAFVKSMKK